MACYSIAMVMYRYNGMQRDSVAHPLDVPHIVSAARARKRGVCYGVTNMIYGSLQHGNDDVPLMTRQ